MAVLGGAVVWLGLLPLGLAIWGSKLHEPLAVPALVVAVAGLAINLLTAASS